MKKLIFLAGVAVGFLAGSRAGRGAYDTIEAKAREVAADPRVQETVGQARDTAVKTAQGAAETVKDKAPELAGAAKEAASTARHRAEGVAESAKETVADAKAGSGDRTTAPDADTDGRTAAAGGDAEVGEKPLES